MIYFYKKILSFLKVFFTLSKSISIYKIVIFILSYLLFSILRLIISNPSMLVMIEETQYDIYWIGFVFLFYKLSKQNFFKHLLINRSFFIAEFEIITLSISAVLLFTILNLPFFPFIGLNKSLIFTGTLFAFTIDAILLANWKILRYLCMHCCLLAIFLLTAYLIHCEVNLFNFVQLQEFFQKYIIILPFVECFLIKKIISNQIKTNFK